MCAGHLRELIELVLAFIALPLVIGIWLRPDLWIPALCLIALAAGFRLARDSRRPTAPIVAPVGWPKVKQLLRRVALRFVVSAGLIFLAARLLCPVCLADSLARPGKEWLAFVLFYPLVSVLAQEVLYRRYMFDRLRKLNLSATQIVWVSAVVFAAMHALFRNEIAVGLTLIAGWFFGDTYRRSGSLALVCLEHTLYGCLAFAVGLWPLFSYEVVARL